MIIPTLAELLVFTVSLITLIADILYPASPRIGIYVVVAWLIDLIAMIDL